MNDDDQALDEYTMRELIRLSGKCCPVLVISLNCQGLPMTSHFPGQALPAETVEAIGEVKTPDREALRIEFDTMEADIKAAHDMIEWFRKHRAHRAQQRDAAKRLHRRK